MNKLILNLLALVFLGSCKSDIMEANHTLEFPQSNFSQTKGPNLHENLLYLMQVGEDSLMVIYDDTLTVRLEDEFSKELIAMQDSYDRFEQENVYANFNLDKSLSYFKLKKIMDQLGKAGFVWGQLTLQDGKVFKKEISLQNNLTNSKDIISEINDYFSSEKFLYCEVSNNSMDFSDSSGTKLNDVKDYLVSPKNDFLIIYKFNPNSTYQDYINFFSLIFKSIDEKRNVFVSKGHTKAEAIKRYPLAMIELENLIYSIPKLLVESDSIPR